MNYDPSYSSSFFLKLMLFKPHRKYSLLGRETQELALTAKTNQPTNQSTYTKYLYNHSATPFSFVFFWVQVQSFDRYYLTSDLIFQPNITRAT